MKKRLMQQKKKKLFVRKTWEREKSSPPTGDGRLQTGVEENDNGKREHVFGGRAPGEERLPKKERKR